MACNCGDGKLIGKYRGKVLDNIDPLGQGRIIAEVPAIPASITNFATPCVPYAGLEVGFFFMPPIGADVWIEFERGDPTFPVWSGCFWSPGELPFLDPPPTTKILKTEFCTFIMNDLPEAGGITLECNPPAVNDVLSMVFNGEGITITSPESVITMTPVSTTITVPEAVITLEAGSITLTVPESVINITPETISATVPPSATTMTAESIVTETPAMDVTVEGATDITCPETNVTGNVSIEGAVEITGETNITGVLTVEGEANFAPEVTIEGDLNVLGAVTIEGDEAVAGVIEGVVVPPLL